MSTQINVTVGSGGLSDKARQLQTAARQAQLEKERQQRIEAEGTEQRNAKLAAEGKTPDGSPLNGPGFKQLEVDRRPAANRQNLVKVSRFYSRFDEAGQYLISGDGAQEVAFNLPPALNVPTFPVLENDSPYPIFPFPAPTSSQLIAQRTTVVSTSPDTVFIETYTKRRVIHTKSSSSLLSFPLGNGNVLIVQFRYFAYASVFTRHYWDRTDLNDASTPLFSLTLEDQSFSAETETNWVEQEDWVSAIVGEQTAQLVTLSDSLKQIIKNESTSTEPVTTYGIASLVCNYAANDTNPSQDGDYSTGTYQCIGFPGTYGYTFYNNVNDKGPVVTLTAQSPLIQGRVINAVQPEQSSYGLVLYGSLYYTEFSASPISWFVVDSTSTRNQLQNASTHEQLRSVELQDGSALGGLLRPKQFVDLSTTPLAWTGQAFTGDLTSYPINSDPSWRGRVKVNDPLLAEYDVHYISDWGRTSFCAQQAARYGITV